MHVTFNVKSVTVDELPKTPWSLWLGNNDKLQLLSAQGVAAKHDRQVVHGTLSTRDWTKRWGITRFCFEDQTIFVTLEGGSNERKRNWPPTNDFGSMGHIRCIEILLLNLAHCADVSIINCDSL